jgi:plastocyanin
MKPSRKDLFSGWLFSYIKKDFLIFDFKKSAMKTIFQIDRSFIILILFTLPLFNLQAKKWVVTVKNYSFTPYNLTHVKAGDTILFQWVEGVHTTTSTSIPTDALDWDYAITQQEPTAMVIPMVNGTFQYVSSPYAPDMNGTFTVSGALGISSLADLPDIRIYPNPAIDHINIMTHNECIQSLRIFDLNGKKLGELSFCKQTGISNNSVDLSNYPPGVFFFEFTLDSNRKRVVRVLHTGN